MKKFMLKLIIFSVLCVLSVSSKAGSILIDELQALSFGEVAVDPLGGAVTVSPKGNISATGGNITQGGHSNAVFKITGDKNTSVIFLFSNGDTLDGPGTSMGLGSFTTNKSSPINLGGNKTAEIKVGATLQVNIPQTGGVYEGTYIFTVEYQ